MEKEFVTYEAAKKLKGLGFDEPCIAVYGYNMQGYPKEMSERLVGIIEISFTEGWPIEPKDLKNSVLGEDISAPTYSSAFRWFREKHDWQHSIDPTADQHSHQLGYNYWIWNCKTGEEHHTMPKNRPAGDWEYEAYEEAETACLEKLLEIAEENDPKIIF